MLLPGLIAGLIHSAVAQEIVVELGCVGVMALTLRGELRLCHSKTGRVHRPELHCGNDRIANDALVLRQINRGSADMPAFGKKLTSEEIVAVGTYIRNCGATATGCCRRSEGR